MAEFEILGEIKDVETIATGRGVDRGGCLSVRSVPSKTRAIG